MKSLFVDTSAWYAMADRRDADNQACCTFWKSLHRQKLRLYTSDYVLDETITLTLKKLDHSAAIKTGSAIIGSRAIAILTVTSEVRERAWQTFQRYHDKEYSFTDCTSFELMRQLGIQHVFGTDSDFTHMGFTVVPAIAD